MDGRPDGEKRCVFKFLRRSVDAALSLLPHDDRCFLTLKSIKNCFLLEK